MESMSYREALKFLADQAGVELRSDYKREDDHDKNEFEKYYKIYAEVAKVYNSQLWTPMGKKAMDYLLGRGISKKTIEEAMLGYTPSNSADILLKHLLSSFEYNDIVESKILMKSNYGDNLYDPFSDRLVFPIFNARSKVVAFGGRVLDSNSKGAKYLNSSENPIFVKKRTLYGINTALQYQKGKFSQEKEMIVVEGYMDVLKLQETGFKNAVAPLGTAITVEHIQQIWRYGYKPVMCMDSDVAGQNASYKILEQSLPYINNDLSLYFCVYNDYKDPDEMISSAGADHFKEVLSRKMPLSKFLFHRLKKEVGFESPEQRSILKSKLFPAV